VSPHAYTEEQLVEQPAIGLFAELGWTTVSALERMLGSGEPSPMSTAAAISGKGWVSPCGENPVLSETPAAKGGLGLIEWLTGGCCKSLISSRFLFE
jgi:hypothetical protein